MSQYAYLFMVRGDLIEGVLLDRWLDISYLTAFNTYDEYQRVMKTYENMGMDKENIDDIKRALEAIPPLIMRERMRVGGELCLVRTDDPLSPEELVSFLRVKQRNGDLRRFLEEAKF